MLENILSDLRLYRHLLSAQIRAQAQYKVNLAIDIGTYFAVTGLEFVAVLLYFGPFPTMLGWKVGEVAMLYAVMSISFGLAEMFGAGIDLFPDTIRLGEFDRVLLRPVSSFILVVGIGSGSLLFMSVLLLGATLCFWTVETTELVNILTYGGRDLLSYPLVIYSPALQRFFLFVVPLAFGSFVPTCYLLGRPLPFGLPGEIVFGAPLAALAFGAVAAVTWRFGVSHYQSTGS